MPRFPQSERESLAKINEILDGAFDEETGSLRVDFVVDETPDAPVTDSDIYGNPGPAYLDPEVASLIKINNTLTNALQPDGRILAVAS